MQRIEVEEALTGATRWSKDRDAVCVVDICNGGYKSPPFHDDSKGCTRVCCQSGGRQAGLSAKFRVVGVKQDLLVIHREFLKQSRPTMTASLATLPLNNTAYGTREYWQVLVLFTPIREVTVDFYHEP